MIASLALTSMRARRSTRSIAKPGGLRGARAAILAAAVAASLLAWASPARAGASGPQWTVTSVSRPTNFVPGDESGADTYAIAVTNTGDAPSDGSTVTVTVELPEGLSLAPAGESGKDQLSGAALTCVLRSCSYAGAVAPEDALIVRVPVEVSALAPPSVTTVARVDGGGAPDAEMQTPTAITDERAEFGISAGGASTALSSYQAGAHPDITTSIAFNTVTPQGSLADDVKDTIDELPPGFASDFVDTPSCPAASFLLHSCSISSQIGVTTVGLYFGGKRPVEFETAPVYDLTPDPGEVAKLGFVVEGVYVEGAIYLRSDYGARVVFENVNQAIIELDSVSLTVWGVPADPIHDPWRWKEQVGQGGAYGEFGTSSDARPAPFFTNPTSCSGQALQADFVVDSWQHPGQTSHASMQIEPMIGCDRLSMQPAIAAESTTDKAYAPSGLDLTMSVPQTYDNPSGLATPTLERAVVELPEGMTVNPSAGVGLGACTPAQYGEEAAQAVAGSGCPPQAKLGSVAILTPALSEEVKGSVYLAQPYDNPFGSLLALYIVARIPDRGVLVKAAGEVALDPVTGRIVTTFDGLPPLPFTTFTFRFNQGATSPLVTPPACGEYAVNAELTPWSDLAGAPLTPSIAPFPISRAFDDGPCPASGLAPFSPQLSAGAEGNDAGAYAPLQIRLARNDGEQEITRFSATLPPGLTANLSGVPFCPDADIAAAKTRSGAQEEAGPSCPTASLIGHTLVGAGVGSVLAAAPGRLYLAGPYNGAPFSIVAITSAKVGPFDLGTVVVREALEIDPDTARVTVDARASDPIPHIIRGIVVHVREIRVFVDRRDFTLNPTDCEPLSFSAVVGGAGADYASSADDSAVTAVSPFRVTACQALQFKPTFKASTSGRTSRADGASLSVKLTYPRAPQGSEANIRSVEVDLPKLLPSNLKTLQQACPVGVFSADPAACPAASRVGTAKAITPILPVPLAGPAYFVSYGNAKFPELVIVLQGYGVTVDLHGETFISKSGVTSSTFRTVPDQPVESFQLTLPEGPHSALAAPESLCKHRLTMPTTFTAQNGAVLRQQTPIAVTGCAKHRARGKRGARKAQRHTHKEKR